MEDIKYLYKLFLECGSVCTDSRNPIKNAIFFALKGQSFNGNLFATEALKKGCRYAVVDEDLPYSAPNIIHVDNVLESLQHLANFHREKLNIPIIAITGSNGKTTTKELLHEVLKTHYKVKATRGNLNNHIGVPLTLLSFTKDTDIGIVEMGANHVGEINQLSKISNPDYGIITNIGKAHVEGFGSFENIKKGKGELYEHLSSRDGTIIYNKDNIHLNELIDNCSCKKISYGTEKDNLVQGLHFTSSLFLSVKLQIKNYNQIIITHSKLVGQYNFENVLAAFTFGILFKIEPVDIKKAVEQYVPSNNRSQLVKTEKNTILIDCYNANPTSMLAALRNFNDIPASKKVMILGDMLELGDDSIPEHAEILTCIPEPDQVFLVGEIFHEISKETSFKSFKKVEDLIYWLTKNPINEACILLKGSRKIKLEKLVVYF